MIETDKLYDIVSVVSFKIAGGVQFTYGLTGSRLRENARSVGGVNFRPYLAAKKNF